MPGNTPALLYPPAVSPPACGPEPAPLLFRSLALLAIAYLSFGKSFAYLGIYPVFIGEVFLACALALQARRIDTAFFVTPGGRLTGILSLIVVLQGSVSLISGDAAVIEILRNVAFIYYALYGLIAYSLTPPESITACARFLREAVIRGAPAILFVVTASMVAYMYFPQDLPVFPGTQVQILYYKPTDASVVLCMLVFLWRQGYLRAAWGTWALLLALIAGARSRAALLCLLFTLLFKFRISRRSLTVLALLVAVFVGLWLSDVSIPLGDYRSVSVRQFASNLSSLSTDAENDDPTTVRNAAWRVRWWQAIVDDAMEYQRVFSGRGWGSNLSTDFGIEEEESDAINSLRSPHNILLGVLGRGGILTALVWCGLYLSLLFGAAAVARTRGEAVAEAGDLCVLALVLGLINGLTDVYLESPQNAIPHWFFIGLMLRLASLPGRSHESATVPAPEFGMPHTGLG